MVAQIDKPSDATTRTTAFSAYTALRAGGKTPANACYDVAEQLHIPTTHVMVWAAEGRWDDLPPAESYALISQDAAFDPTNRLALLAENYRTGEDLIRYTAQELHTHMALSPEEQGRRPNFMKLTIENWQLSVKGFRELTQELRAAEAEIRLRAVTTAYAAELADYRDQVLGELNEQYGGFGPQYRILTEQLANIKVHQKRLDLAGITMTTSDLMKMDEQVRQAVGQLQRYTESTKTDILNQRFQAGVEALAAKLEDVYEAKPEEIKKVVEAARSVLANGEGE